MGRFYDLVRSLICSLHSMPLTLCETLYDLRLVLYALRSRDNAMRYALCLPAVGMALRLHLKWPTFLWRTPQGIFRPLRRDTSTLIWNHPMRS